MKPVLVAFATREGQTRRIAEHIASTIRARGNEAEVLDVGSGAQVDPDLKRYAAVLLAASVHLGRHEREMVDFVKAHHQELEQLPTAFLSVSLSEAGVEDTTASFEARSKAAVDVKKMIDDFCHQTGIHPITRLAGRGSAHVQRVRSARALRHAEDRQAGRPVDRHDA